MGATGRTRIDITVAVLCVGVVMLAVIGGDGVAPVGDAAPPPAQRFDHGAAGSALNGTGGEIAPSPTGASWPGTGLAGNGGAIAFMGAQYGSLWNIPPAPNNSLGVGYCVMEDVGGTGTVTRQPDPTSWDDGEMARAAALMATFGGDRVVPYGIDSSGPYDVATGEWQQPSLFGGGEYTRRRHVAVNFGVKLFVEDVSPTGAATGRKLARDTAVVNGSDGNFAALRNGYAVAQRMADVTERQHAVGGLHLTIAWGTADGEAPTGAGTYRVDVRATDGFGKPVGFVPILQLSDIGIDGNRSVGTVATVDQSNDTADDAARWNAAHATGWPTWDAASRLADDARFTVRTNPLGADVADETGIARFHVDVPGPHWELGFHALAPTAEVDLYAGTGIQGQITWSGTPQSAIVHHVAAEPTPPPSTTPPPVTPPPTPPPVATTSSLPPPTTPPPPTSAPPTSTPDTSAAATTTPPPAPPAPVTTPPPTSAGTTTTTMLPPTATTAPPPFMGPALSTTIVATVPPPRPSPPPALPRTGTARHGATIGAALALLLMGAGLVIITRRASPRT